MLQGTIAQSSVTSSARLTTIEAIYFAAIEWETYDVGDLELLSRSRHIDSIY
jgi:hypothetical protein